MTKKPNKESSLERPHNELCLLLVSTAMATIVIIGLMIYGG